MTYTIVASNAGPSTAASVTVTDTFAAVLTGCSTTSVAAGGATGNDAGPVAGNLNDGGITLPPSSSVTYTATCNISSAATGTLDNSASVATVTPDPATGNNTATDSDTLNKITDLAITKTSDTNPVAANQVFNYLITVQNIGPSDSIGFTVTDNLPPATSVAFVSAAGTGWSCGAPVALVLTCTHGALTAGASTATLTVQMQVAAIPTPPVFTNTATVSTVENDPVAGNNTASVEVSTDVTPPTVVQVSASHGAAAGDIAECESFAAKVKEIALRFSEQLQGGPGTGANDPANYLLVRRGADNDFDTTSCVSGAVGDDVEVPIDQAILQPNTPSSPFSTVRLSVNGRVSLPNDLYRLFACDELSDPANNNLDGDGAGGEGGDFVRSFRIDALNHLDNGHLDCNQDSWTVQTVSWIATEDYQGSENSGASRAAATSSFIDQCTDLSGGVAPFDVDGRIKIDGSILVGWV